MSKQFEATNEFGEKHNLTVSDTEAQSLVDQLQPKTGVAAITALAGDADLPTAVAKINSILAALKVVS